MSMLSLRRLLLAAAFIAGTAGMAEAQETRSRKIEISGDDIQGQPYTIEELGALVVNKGGALQVLFTMPEEHRLKLYKDVDIHEGDHIMMVNGKKASSTSDLEAALVALKAGDQIKIGLKRGKDMKIVSFPKADPAQLPKVRRMVVNEGDDGDGPQMSVEAGGVEEDVAVMTGGGLIARAGKTGLEIAYLLPDAETILKDADIKEGDRLLRLQDQPVSDLDGLTAAWDKIKVGDQVSLVLSRDGKEIHVTFVRAEAPGAGVMMITR